MKEWKEQERCEKYVLTDNWNYAEISNCKNQQQYFAADELFAAVINKNA